jgi:multicomponent K+:H+ antiporter subunit E
VTHRSLIPHPIWSAALALFWLWLNNSVAAGPVAVGILLGWALPFFARRFWPERERVARPWLLLPFALVVMADIFVANLRVARAVLSPVRRLRPGFVRVPLAVRSDIGIMVLASTVSLTPGTLSADLSDDRSELIVHYLDESDAEAMVALIKSRYERTLLEVFG